MALAHSPRIVTDGLILCLDAGNPKSYPGSGSVWNDLTKNGNNGSLINGVGYDSANGGTITFDGVNDIVTVSNITTPNKTFSLWCEVPATDAGQRQVFSMGTNSVSCIGLCFNSTRNGSSQVAASSVIYGGLTDTGSFSVPSGVTTGEIHNFVFMSDSSGYLTQFYIDATSIPSTTQQARVYTVEQNIRFANRTDGQFKYAGKISQFLVYDRTLTAEEVQQNYNALKGRYTT
jgi:hypothetical protein